LRFACSLQRSPAAPCRPGLPSFRTIPLRRFPAAAPTPSAGSPLRFLSPRALSLSSHAQGAARANHSWVISFRPRTGLATRAVIAAWPGLLIPATLLGFTFPSQCCSDPRVRPPYRCLAPTCRFALRRREFHRRGARFLRRARGAWPRLLGSLPRISRAVSSADPAIAFAHRVDHTHQPGLPWVFFLSQVFHAGL